MRLAALTGQIGLSSDGAARFLTQAWLGEAGNTPADATLLRGVAEADDSVRREVTRALNQFTDLAFCLSTVGAMALAVTLAAALAYHPSELRKATTRDDLEQPKTMVLYGLVGSLVGHIVQGSPSLALVIFGIGGLMRFRTDVGAAKGTGRLILSALVGICVGLHAYVVAVLATLFAWGIVWFLERRVIGSVQLLGVETANMPATSEAYRRLLLELSCRVVGETRNPNKGEIQIVFVSPLQVNADVFSKAAAALAPELRATPAWTLN